MIFKKFFNKDADKIQYFANKFNLSPRIAELVLARGINDEEKVEEFLNPKIFHDPMLLNGMKELVDRVKLAKELKDKVLVFGDYDVDGVSATAIMIKALEEFGIKADYYLPNRYIDGYGLTNSVIDKIADIFAPNLIITVDCGVSCYQEIEYAKNKGIEIIVTDHHDIPEIIPDTIVVDAKIEGQQYPFKELCGTGVAYKFAEALLGSKKAEQYLPITAIATIVDIVPLVDENRTIVTRGLNYCDKYLPIGLRMMFKEYDLSLTKPNATDISFKIGPKLNASGRMGDANDSLKLYFETDPVKIKKDLEKIKQHNLKRQDICNRIYEDCEKALSKVDMKNQRVITLASKLWDKGVLGIVCSRLVEKYHKPVFLFAQEGDLLCGSGRSIDDINIHELLSSLKDILETFGGHSMAAGLTLKRKNYELFTQKINSFALNSISDEVFIPIKYYDQDITEEEITPEFIKELAVLEPFGCENPRPKFKITASDVEIMPMKKYPQHANIKIGSLNLTYFNFLSNVVKITFSRQKSFIFEFQTRSMKGTVNDFDGGSFIVEDAYKKLNAIELNQLTFDCKAPANYVLYPKDELLNFVGKTTTTVFGTCFVTYSCFEYVEFTKNYNTKGIYNIGIYEDKEIGYNTILLAPKGLDWAKNFSRIVFLSPVLDTSYISALNQITDAEIFVPIEKSNDVRKFAGLDLERTTYGKIFKSISSKAGRSTYNVFELFDKCDLSNFVSFTTFYSALLVFSELNLITIECTDQIVIRINKNVKRELSDSKIYNNLMLLKNTFKGKMNMENENSLENIKELVNKNYNLNDKEKEVINKMLAENLNFARLEDIIKNIIAYKLDKISILSFINYQLYKVKPELADEIALELDDETRKMIEDFKTIKDINQLTLSEEIDDIRRMFIVMSKDMRVVIIKLFGICYDISILQSPLNDSQKYFVKQVREIHVPLSERLGLDKIKLKLYDNVVRIEYPKEYAGLKMAIESKREENEQQLAITKAKIEDILVDLHIAGKIESRIKNVSSIFNKLHNKQLTLDQIYDILAMRVIVNSVEECYAVMGRVHGIYKPMIGRVKDYIANPKPNGYKSLHTTIIVENQHPMEIQIRTKDMHKESEYGVYAHWLYKENKGKKNDFDNRLTWFRQTIDNATNMSNEDFIDTLKSDLYSGVIIAQTPKGRVIEFPEGSTVIDFAYAIHSDVGNSCVGAKINGKLRPITTPLHNGDIVEILTNSHSKGPSRDWLKFVKTSGARSKIKAFFKSELRDENIKLGKSMFTQTVQDRGYFTSQFLTESYLAEILKRYNADDMDEIYASIGSGSLSAGQVVSRFQNLFNNDNKELPKAENVVHLKRNKDGVLVDGDSGMLVRYAGCCNPIEGDDIIGYISRGKGVTIHRDNCPNIKYLEKERLIDAQWQVKENATFIASIRVIATKQDNNIGKITSLITALKINIKGFDVKDVGDNFVCTLIIEVKNKDELNSAMVSIKNIKNVISVYRSER